jgi:hypothetical protein
MFEKGNRYANGGARPNSGPPSKQVIADRQFAQKEFERRAAAAFGELWNLAIKVCRGIKRKRFYPKDYPLKPGEKRFYYEIEYDTATLRFLIERFVPPAKQSIDVNLKTGFEKLIQQLEDEEQKEKERLEKATDVTPDEEKK